MDSEELKETLDQAPGTDNLSEVADDGKDTPDVDYGEEVAKLTKENDSLLGKLAAKDEKISVLKAEIKSLRGKVSSLSGKLKKALKDTEFAKKKIQRHS